MRTRRAIQAEYGEQRSVFMRKKLTRYFGTIKSVFQKAEK
jgi:hypothetical protein